MGVLMAIGKGVPHHVNAYLRDWIAREWLAKGRNQKELAVSLGATKTTISDFLATKRGAGYELFTGLARVIGRTREEIEVDAESWWRDQGNAVNAAKKEPYPNRAAALEFLRAELPREVVERTRSLTIDAANDPSRSWWVARIMSELDLHRVSKG